MQDFIERYQNVTLDVLTVLCACPAIRVRPAEASRRATVAAKKLFEEVAEARALKMKFGSLPGASAEPLLLSRRLPFLMVPVRRQLIIFSTPIRVTENFVCLIDLLESIFRTSSLLKNSTCCS